MSRFHRLTVTDVRRETPDSVSIAFEIPETLRDDYRFTPGQYLTLRAEIDGEAVQRTYSICSGLTTARSGLRSERWRAAASPASPTTTWSRRRRSR